MMSSVFALKFHLSRENLDNKICAQLASNAKNSVDGIETHFKFISKMGKGTFGSVYKAENTRSAKIVAIKVLSHQNIGLITSEVLIMKSLDHINVIKLLQVYHENYIDAGPQSAHCLVLEFCDYDLCQLLLNPRVEFTLSQIKSILQQMFTGIQYIHSKGIVHRDLKPANILLSKKGCVKIADFGLSKFIHRPTEKNVHYFPSGAAVSLVYRPPELLLGFRADHTSIDVWSAGCIMAQMWSRTPLMHGFNEEQQLLQISKVCGPINSITLLGRKQMDDITEWYLPQHHPRIIKEILMEKFVDDINAGELIDRLLCLNPEKRITADRVLMHAFFRTEPLPCSFSLILDKVYDY